MAGRKPKPTAIKELSGNPGKRKLNKREPRPDVVCPEPPRGRLSESGRRFWKDAAPILAGMGVLTAADVFTFELMANHYGLAVDAMKAIRSDGMIVEGAKGGVIKHPAVQIWRDNATAFRQYAAEFGMTPSARSRLSLAPEEEQTLADLLFAAAGLDS